MDRRNFIKTLMASGVLGASPLVSRAASEFLGSGVVQPVLIVGQSGLTHTAGLIARVEQLLAAVGVQCVQEAAGGSELLEFSRVSALLDRKPGSRVIGVMDDAAAMIFQEVAAARGAACVLSTHHRFTGREVRHCCTTAGLEESLVWTDAFPSHAERISHLYAGTISGGAADRGAPVMGMRPANFADAAPGSLVSFLINI